MCDNGAAPVCLPRRASIIPLQRSWLPVFLFVRSPFFPCACQLLRTCPLHYGVLGLSSGGKQRPHTFVNFSINQSISQSINQSINHSLIHSFIHSFIHSSVHSFNSIGSTRGRGACYRCASWVSAAPCSRAQQPTAAWTTRRCSSRTCSVDPQHPHRVRLLLLLLLLLRRRRQRR